MNATTWHNELQNAVEIATFAGELAMKHFVSGIEFTKKDDDSPVTVADRECESLIRSRLSKLYAGDALLGEEEGESPGPDCHRKWIIDPIDGTYNFARGVPVFSVLIALEVEGRIVAGVVHNPALNETFAASCGGGAFKNGRRIKVSAVENLCDAYFVFGEPARVIQQGLWNGFARLISNTYKHRGFGDYLSFGYVFEGKAELGLEVGVKPWDLAPMKIIVEEAGGKFTDLAGAPTIYSGHCLYSNGRCHEGALKLLAGA